MSIRSKLRMRYFVSILALAACMGGLMRAEDKPEPETPLPPFATYIGELSDSPESARIAFVVEGDTFVAYVCSGDQPFNDTFSRWYRGDVKDGKMTVTVDGVQLTAAIKDDGIAGKLKKDKAHEFIAKAIPGDANAGLFRAADKFGDDDVIFGWIMDEKGSVVGTAGKKGGPVQTLPQPKGNGNISGTVNGQKVAAGKVTGTGNNPTGGAKVKKFDAAARAAFVQDVVAEQKAAGGNPVQAMLLHQVRRFLAGKKAETKLEERTFAALAKAPKDSLTTYLKNWDALPAATRDALVGAAGKQLDTNKALDAAQSKKFVRAIPQAAKLNTKAGTPQQGAVKGVNISTVKCVDETNPEAFGQDEVFALHAVVVGTTGPVFKQTGVLREFDDGITQLFPAADKVVFPQPGLTPTAGAEVMVVTTLFEDDGAVLLQVLNTLKPLIETAIILVIEGVAEAKDIPLDDATKEAIKTGVKGVVDGAISALSNLLVQPLGSDIIIIKPNGTVVGTNGAAKNKMTFKRVKNGDVRHEYELLGFEVQK